MATGTPTRDTQLVNKHLVLSPVPSPFRGSPAAARSAFGSPNALVKQPTLTPTQAGYKVYGKGVLGRRADSPARTPLSARKARAQALQASARSLVSDLRAAEAEEECMKAEIEFERQVQYESIRDSMHDDDSAYVNRERRYQAAGRNHKIAALAADEARCKAEFKAACKAVEDERDASIRTEAQDRARAVRDQALTPVRAQLSALKKERRRFERERRGEIARARERGHVIRSEIAGCSGEGAGAGADVGVGVNGGHNTVDDMRDGAMMPSTPDGARTPTPATPLTPVSSVSHSRVSSRSTSRATSRAHSRTSATSRGDRISRGGRGSGNSTRTPKGEHERRHQMMSLAAARADAAVKQEQRCQNPVRCKELALEIGTQLGRACRGAKALKWLKKACIPVKRAELIEVEIGMDEEEFDEQAPYEEELQEQLHNAEDKQRRLIRSALAASFRLHLRLEGALAQGGEGGVYDVSSATELMRRWLSLAVGPDERMISLVELAEVLAEAETVHEATEQIAGVRPDDAALHLRHSLGPLGDLRLEVMEELARSDPEALPVLRQQAALYLRRADISASRQLHAFANEAQFVAHPPDY